MHIADLSKGMLGANGIVGGGPPLVCGVGLTAKVRGTDQVGRRLLRRRRLQPGHVPREPQPRRRLEPARASSWSRTTATPRRPRRDYHQSGVDVAKRADGFGMPGVSRRRPRLLRRLRGRRRGDRARPLRRRADAARVQGHAATSATSRATRRPTAAPSEVEELRARRATASTRFARAGHRRRDRSSDDDARRRSTTRCARSIDEAVARGQGGRGPDRRRPAHRRLRRATRGAYHGSKASRSSRPINEALAPGDGARPDRRRHRRGHRRRLPARRGEEDAWGGVIGVDQGALPPSFPGRVLDTPISESAFIGAAAGAAASGPAPRRRADVRRLHGRVLRPDLQPGGEVPLHVRRQGQGADGDPHDVRRRHPGGRAALAGAATRSSPTSRG